MMEGLNVRMARVEGIPEQVTSLPDLEVSDVEVGGRSKV